MLHRSALVLLLAVSATACTGMISSENGAALGGDDDSSGPIEDPGGDDDGAVLPASRRVIGYFPSWGIYTSDYQASQIPAQLLTHINYAFLNISGGKCVLGDPSADTGSFAKLAALKSAHPGLEVILSVGGWTWSAGFSDAALTDASRRRFATSCVDLMEQYGFDGLDIDWEYPGGGGLNAGRGATDTKNYTFLLAALRAELDARGDHYRLTIAAPVGDGLIAQMQVGKIHPYLDWINLMTYDFHGSWDSRTGFNAPLEKVAGDFVPSSVTSAVNTWLGLGVPADKLVVGVPFYGRGWAGVGATNHGLLQGSSGPSDSDGMLEWRDIKANYLNWPRYWSDTAQVPWLYNPSQGVMISYDDPQSIAAKGKLVRDRALGGMMIWELSNDDAANTLLTAVHGEMVR